jgi:hypothetical protein
MRQVLALSRPFTPASSFYAPQQAVDMGWLASRGFRFLRCAPPEGGLPPECSELVFVFAGENGTTVPAEGVVGGGGSAGSLGTSPEESL